MLRPGTARQELHPRHWHNAWVTESTKEDQPVREKLFELLLELRERHVYIVGTLVASFISAMTFLPIAEWIVDDRGQVQPWTIWIRVICLVLIPFLAAADKAADWEAKRVAKEEGDAGAAEAQRAYRQSISSLLLLANKGADIAQETQGQRKTQLRDLRTALVATTHGLSTAAQTRATYYTLEFAEEGRVLREPVSHGRVEESTTIWVESEDPDHSVWNIMDGNDLNAPIVRDTDENRASWVEWENKKYRSFISVPVKAHDVQFGMLSLNAPDSEDLTETDRMAVLVAARIMASTLSLAMTSAQLKERSDNLAKLKKRSDSRAKLPASSDTERS